MCHKTKTDRNDGKDIPEVDTQTYEDVEPLPESSRERRDGPGGN